MMSVIFVDILALILAIFFWILFFVFGKKILKFFKFNLENFLEEFLFSSALGLGSIIILVFIFGHFKILNSTIILSFLILTALICHVEIIYFFQKLKTNFAKTKKIFSEGRIFNFFLVITALFLLLNLLRALSPEIEFDSLWYHLTLPKLYLENQQILQFSGQLEMVSKMPRALEMLYLVSFTIFKTELLAKILHFSLFLAGLVTLFSFSLRVASKKVAIIAVAIFSSLPVIFWLSQTCYVDFGILFFGFLAFYGFYLWLSTPKNKKWLILSGILLGISFSIKLLNLYLIPVFSLAIIFQNYFHNLKISPKHILLDILIFISSIIIAFLPWAVEALIWTKNPLYPLFSVPPDWQNAAGGNNLKEWLFHFQPLTLWPAFKNIFLMKLTPILIFFPILLFFIKDQPRQIKFFYFLAIAGFFFWTYLPVHEARYLIASIPLLVIFSAFSLQFLLDNKIFANWAIYSLLSLILIAQLGYLADHNRDFYQVAFGLESRNNFLNRKVNNIPWNFYDSDQFLPKKLKPNEKVLVYGIHNFYYFDFPFMDAVAIQKDFVQTKNLNEILRKFKKYQIAYIAVKVSDLRGLLNYLTQNSKIAGKIMHEPNFSQKIKKISDKHSGTSFLFIYKISYPLDF